MSTIMQINPFDFFVDADGDALDAGYVWIGQANLDPRQYPVTVYFDAALTIPAPMPLRTSGGYIVQNGAATFLYINGNYSVMVEDSRHRQVYYVPDFLLIGSSGAVSMGDLGNTTDFNKGVAIAGRASVAVECIKDLLTQPQRTDLRFLVKGYYAGTRLGSGDFYWDPTVVRSSHNGGSIISPTVPWDGLSTSIQGFLNGSGETNPSALGCFVIAQDYKQTSPEMFGFIPSFSVANTASFQAAVFAAANGECILSAANYRTGPIMIKGFTRISGPGRGTAVILDDNAATHLFTVNDPAVDTNIEVVGFRINGNRGNQTLANDGIHFTSTLPGVGLTRHLVKDMWVTNTKGGGIFMDTACRESLVTGCNLSDCDGVGLFAGWSDGQISDCIVGRSGLSGVLVRQGLQLTNVKSWFSGRIDSIGRGFEIRDADNAKLVNCWSQENKGHGFDVFSTGAGINGVQLLGCTADSDNTSNTGKNGFNIVNAINSRFDVVNRVFAGSAGSPANGMAVGDATVDCEITLNSQGHTSRPIELNNAQGNHVSVNGREGRVRQVTYSAAISSDPWQQETIRIFLTGNITVNDPQKSPHGIKLRYIFNQDTTGGRIVTFGASFVVNWTPNTAANKTNIIEFLCDGTLWIQVSTATGL